MVGPDGNAPSSLAYRASALLLSYEPVAESGGLAPQPAIAGPSVFETAPAPRRVHSPRKMAESSGPAPQALRPEPVSNRTPRSAALLSKVAEARGHAPQQRCRPIRFKRVPAPRPVSPPKVPPAGFAPASIRLEGGGLNCSATGSGPRGGTPTRNPAFEAPHDGNFTTRGKSGPLTRTCTSISSFAGSRPVSWTMKGKLEPAAGVAPAWSDLQGRHVARYV